MSGDFDPREYNTRERHDEIHDREDEWLVIGPRERARAPCRTEDLTMVGVAVSMALDQVAAAALPRQGDGALLLVQRDALDEALLLQVSNAELFVSADPADLVRRRPKTRHRSRASATLSHSVCSRDLDRGPARVPARPAGPCRAGIHRADRSRSGHRRGPEAHGHASRPSSVALARVVVVRLVTCGQVMVRCAGLPGLRTGGGEASEPRRPHPSAWNSTVS